MRKMLRNYEFDDGRGNEGMKHGKWSLPEGYLGVDSPLFGKPGVEGMDV